MFSSLQQQFLSYWKKQSLGKQITMGSLTLAALILIPVMISWANKPSYAVAYTGLSEADAAQIVQKLDENSIPYQLKNSGTIQVPTDQVYPVRLLMAREGLPQSSTVGYELFSGSSMLGMTEFAQQVNYQRAVEGELERTIGSLDAVQAVRVHLVIPEKTLLSSDQSSKYRLRYHSSQPRLHIGCRPGTGDHTFGGQQRGRTQAGKRGCCRYRRKHAG